MKGSLNCGVELFSLSRKEFGFSLVKTGKPWPTTMEASLYAGCSDKLKGAVWTDCCTCASWFGPRGRLDLGARGVAPVTSLPPCEQPKSELNPRICLADSEDLLQNALPFHSWCLGCYTGCCGSTCVCVGNLLLHVSLSQYTLFPFITRALLLLSQRGSQPANKIMSDNGRKSL